MSLTCGQNVLTHGCATTESPTPTPALSSTGTGDLVAELLERCDMGDDVSGTASGAAYVAQAVVPEALARLGDKKRERLALAAEELRKVDARAWLPESVRAALDGLSSAFMLVRDVLVDAANDRALSHLDRAWATLAALAVRADGRANVTPLLCRLRVADLVEPLGDVGAQLYELVRALRICDAPRAKRAQEDALLWLLDQLDLQGGDDASTAETARKKARLPRSATVGRLYDKLLDNELWITRKELCAFLGWSERTFVRRRREFGFQPKRRTDGLRWPLFKLLLWIQQQAPRPDVDLAALSEETREQLASYTGTATTRRAVVSADADGLTMLPRGARSQRTRVRD